MIPAGDSTCNPGMCSDWELNWKPFGAWEDAQPTELQWPELDCYF